MYGEVSKNASSTPFKFNNPAKYKAVSPFDKDTIRQAIQISN